MRPLGWLGVILIIAGAVVLAMRGISYTKERQAVQVGPLQVSAERKGFVPPVVGGAAIVVGIVLVLAGRRRV
jgi:UDP-N-acetylmuramyl pentapeptide phosphotransferase/UDP-N-acetylglucosamine-1-phosphate transferase